jgi:hypothetical protein
MHSYAPYRGGEIYNPFNPSTILPYPWKLCILKYVHTHSPIHAQRLYFPTLCIRTSNHQLLIHRSWNILFIMSRFNLRRSLFSSSSSLKLHSTMRSMEMSTYETSCLFPLLHEKHKQRHTPCCTTPAENLHYCIYICSSIYFPNTPKKRSMPI